MEENIIFISSSSTKETCFEDYNWIEEENLPNETKMNFLEYPLNIWKNILDEDFKGYQINYEGPYYQKVVNKILAENIFKDMDFHKKENGVMDFIINNVYKIDYDLLIKKSIAPDFFVYKIPVNYFFDLLEKRKSMMITKYNIPKDKKYISIIGEIKTRCRSAHKNNNQRKDYLNFINLVNNINKSDEFLILMYIYDESFFLFKKELSEKEQDQYPIIYGYIPKLYYENCYKTYNALIDLLGLSEEKIDISKKEIFKKKITKKQLLLENEMLLNRLLEREKNKNYNNFYFILGLIIIIIINFITYFVGVQRGSSFNGSNSTK